MKSSLSFLEAKSNGFYYLWGSLFGWLSHIIKRNPDNQADPVSRKPNDPVGRHPITRIP